MAAAGTRRAVVRSERFMEWQRELSSRVPYGSRRRYDDSTDNNCSVKQYQRKRLEHGQTGAKQQMGVAEQAERLKEMPRNQGQQEQQEKVQEQQHQDRRQNSKEGVARNGSRQAICRDQQACSSKQGQVVRGKNSRQQKQQEEYGQGRKQHWGSEAMHEPPKEEVLSKKKNQTCSHVESKQSLPDQQGEASSLQDHDCATKPNHKRRRRAFNTKQALQSSDRLYRPAIDETNVTVNLPSNKMCCGRSRRSARKMALEEPKPPPLKLPKLHLVLTRQEIQEDWFKITGQRYSGKPKKSTLAQLGLSLCTSLTCPSTIEYLHDLP